MRRSSSWLFTIICRTRNFFATAGYGRQCPQLCTGDDSLFEQQWHIFGHSGPLVFPPDTPRNVQVVNNGDGTVTLNWSAPVSDGARGGVATGYVIYESSNGYGFGKSHNAGALVLTATLSGPAAEETRYYRIAASNAGGESMPSEVLAVRRPALRDTESTYR